MNPYIFASILVSIIALKYLSPVLIHLILSLFFTILIVPIFRFFEQKGLPPALSYLITLAGFIALMVGVIMIVQTSMQEFYSSLPFYQEKLRDLFAKLNHSLMSHNIDTSALRNIDMMGILKIFLSNFGEMLKGFIIVVIGVSFLLFESKDFRKKLSAMVKEPHKFEDFFDNVQTYFLIKTLTSLLTGVLIGTMLYLFDIPYAFLFGVLSFLLNYIPVIGSIVAAVPGVLMALLNYDPKTAIWVGLGYLVVNISVSNVIEPKVMGDGLDISAAVVFFSLVFWGWLFGIVGTFFAVPLTMTLKLALQSNPNTKHWAFLLSRYREPKAA
ncbi:MAG: AI-2E family transporter [Epsilonproteobacteria bacterium]|nr:AI-2E family transporter [Campylobacterota bacterium]